MLTCYSYLKINPKAWRQGANWHIWGGGGGGWKKVNLRIYMHVCIAPVHRQYIVWWRPGVGRGEELGRVRQRRGMGYRHNLIIPIILAISVFMILFPVLHPLLNSKPVPNCLLYTWCTSPSFPFSNPKLGNTGCFLNVLPSLLLPNIKTVFAILSPKPPKQPLVLSPLPCLF